MSCRQVLAAVRNLNAGNAKEEDFTSMDDWDSDDAYHSCHSDDDTGKMFGKIDGAAKSPIVLNRRPLLSTVGTRAQSSRRLLDSESDDDDDLWGPVVKSIPYESLPVWSEYAKRNKSSIEPSSRWRESLDEFMQLIELANKSLKPGWELKAAKLPDKLVIWPGGDLTKLKIDVIVNAANTALFHGGGICGAIFDAAGPRRLRKACICALADAKSCPTGEARLTPGFRLPARYIIHAVGPTDKNNDKLAASYKNTLEIMKTIQARSIGFCCISTGIYGFDSFQAAIVALISVRHWLLDDDNIDAVDRIVFSAYTIEDRVAYETLMPLGFPVDGCPVNSKAKAARPSPEASSFRVPKSYSIANAQQNHK